MAKKNLNETLKSLNFMQGLSEEDGLAHSLPYPIIETHCHLDYLKNISIEDLLKTAHKLRIEKLMTIAVSPENLDTVMELAQAHENVFCTQGIHPHNAIESNPNAIDKIKTQSKNYKCVAIGEIGLDYYYNKSPTDCQKKTFEELLEVATINHLPVVIHTRDADDDTIAILKNFSQKLKGKGVIHSFTSGIKLAEFVLSEGFALGFNGIITFKNSANVLSALELAPRSQILLETDSPFLTPVPHRGEENNPLYLPFIAAKMAEVKNLSPLEILKETYKNTLHYFPKLNGLQNEG